MLKKRRNINEEASEQHMYRQKVMTEKQSRANIQNETYVEF